jgi:hypothetical protein
MQWYDYVAVYIFAEFIASHLQLMLMPGGFLIGLFGCIAFHQLFELYCSWRVRWKE